jgi:hypothetical protein
MRQRKPVVVAPKLKTETLEDFLKRKGEIQKFARGTSGISPDVSQRRAIVISGNHNKKTRSV